MPDTTGRSHINPEQAQAILQQSDAQVAALEGLLCRFGGHVPGARGPDAADLAPGLLGVFVLLWGVRRMLRDAVRKPRWNLLAGVIVGTVFAMFPAAILVEGIEHGLFKFKRSHISMMCDPGAYWTCVFFLYGGVLLCLTVCITGWIRLLRKGTGRDDLV